METETETEMETERLRGEIYVTASLSEFCPFPRFPKHIDKIDIPKTPGI